MSGASSTFLLASFFALGLLVYAPALDGAFVSDDAHYVADNPFVQDPSPANVAAILDPFGLVPQLVANYAPVHLLLHALEWQLFGRDVRGYHVVNVALHAVASLLLAILLWRCGVPRTGALLAGAIFLLHPANVEAVAWISQLKTPCALALALAALLAHPRHPALALLLFALGLLAKPVAAVALPVAALLAWLRPPLDAESRAASGRQWAWLVAWAVLLAGFSWAELAAFASQEPPAPIHPDARVRIQTSLVLVFRYLWMAVSGRGLSTFHEPAVVLSAGDPELLGAVVALGLIGWRTLVALKRRSVEAAFWIWALLSFIPVAQILPFRYPLADRYLYFLLPGLLGGVSLAIAEGLARSSWRSFFARPAARWTTGAVATLLLVHFALLTHARAAVWKTPMRVVVDAAAHYPQGTHALLLRARALASAGDADECLSTLRTLFEEKGWNRFLQLQSDPAFARLREDPRLEALLAEMAGQWIEYLEARPASQLSLRVLSAAHETRGEMGEAERALDRALELEGQFTDVVRADLEALRAR